MGLSSKLYQTARVLRDIEVLASLNPKRIVKRLINKAIAKAMGRIYLR